MKILVVDDERDMQQLFEQRFRKEINENVVELVFAFSGEEALSYLEKNQHDAVLILSDINMPGMTGLELLSQIKKKYVEPAPKVMIMTAYGDDQNYNAAKELGADEFLTKPIAFNILKEKLKPQL
jgi:two-component system, chemotaxis family, chemotaxis protein CheY